MKVPFRKLIVSPTEALLLTSEQQYNKLLKQRNINIVTDSNECYDLFGFIWSEWVEVSETVLKSI